MHLLDIKQRKRKTEDNKVPKCEIMHDLNPTVDKRKMPRAFVWFKGEILSTFLT